MSRVLAFPGDTIVIRKPGTPPVDREYRITGSGGGHLMLEPILPTEDGLYMTTNNIDNLDGVLLERLDGHWSILDSDPNRRTPEAQRAQIERWNETLGLTRVYLTASRPASSAPRIPKETV